MHRMNLLLTVDNSWGISVNPNDESNSAIKIHTNYRCTCTRFGMSEGVVVRALHMKESSIAVQLASPV